MFLVSDKSFQVFITQFLFPENKDLYRFFPRHYKLMSYMVELMNFPPPGLIMSQFKP